MFQSEPQRQPISLAWKAYPRQQFEFDPDGDLEGVLQELKGLPPLVFSNEIDMLSHQLREAKAGKRMILQAGDCAESFVECRSPLIASKFKMLLQMAMLMAAKTGKKVTTVGRMAGQYAKPRSSKVEHQAGRSMPVYRGDMVHGIREEDRRPDPRRMLKAYFHSAATLNFVRSMIQGGFSDDAHCEQWRLGFEKYFRDEGLKKWLQQVEDQPTGAARTEFFVSHEALVLEYEEAFCRSVPRKAFPYLLSTHLPWIGDRTRSLHGAHVQFCAGLMNPVGLKVGPGADPAEIKEVVHTLKRIHPSREVVLILRLGRKRFADKIDALLQALQSLDVAWFSDPMHGNTDVFGDGRKTRRFSDILFETQAAMKALGEYGLHLSGLHLEITSEWVQECLYDGEGDGVHALTPGTSRVYKSLCDPRLNYFEALQLINQVF